MNWNFWALLLLGLLLLSGLFVVLEDRGWSTRRLGLVVGATGLLWGAFTWWITR